MIKEAIRNPQKLDDIDIVWHRCTYAIEDSEWVRIGAELHVPVEVYTADNSNRLRNAYE